MTKNALLSKEDSYEVIVDNGTARENVTRFAQHAGYQVSCTEQDGDYHLSLTR